MRASYVFKHLNDRELLDDLLTWARSERNSTAGLVARIAEADQRRLYVPAGYPSMFAYCVDVLHLSEDAAYKRIRAARAAREYPEIFEALADGRLNLTAVTLLAPHLTRENAEDLLAAAGFKGKTQVEELLAARFPRPDAPTRLTPLRTQLAPERVETRGLAPAQVARELAPERVHEELAPEPVGVPPGGVPVRPVVVPMPVDSSRPATVKAIAPRRFVLQVTVDDEFRDLLQEAQALLSHAVPAGEVAQVLKRGLTELVNVLKKRKCAAVRKPRAGRKATHGRTIPAHVRREVWERDQGRCTFVSDSGHRCESRKLLEFDHVEPFARGGRATIDGVRLRCRAHNQYEAEQIFGSGFMARKRATTGVTG